MKSVAFVKKIRNYAIASFIIPLIAINSCLLIFKYLGDINISLFPDFDWSIEKTYTYATTVQKWRRAPRDYT